MLVEKEKEIQHGINLLLVLNWIEQQVKRGNYTEGQATRHRKMVASRLNEILTQLKPHPHYKKENIKFWQWNNT